MLLTLSMLTFVSSASSLAPSDGTYRYAVQGFYTQFGFESTWTRSVLQNDGSVVETSSYRYTSDFIPCGGFKTVFFTRGSSAPQSNTSVAFYDIDKVFISYSPAPAFISVPDDARYVRLTQARYNSMTFYGSMDIVNASNYQYIFHRLENISVDSNNNVIIPYQIEPFYRVMIDVVFFSANNSFSNVSVRGSAKYVNSGTDIYQGYVPFQADSFISFAYLEPLYYNDGVLSVYDFGTGATANNPFSLSASTNGNFCGFRLNIPSQGLSTSVSISLDEILLNDQTIVAVHSVDDTLSALNGLANDLSVPLPSIDPNNVISNALNNVDMQSGFNFFTIFYDNKLIPLMLLISVSFALLGYIFFGKRGEG